MAWRGQVERCFFMLEVVASKRTPSRTSSKLFSSSPTVLVQTSSNNLAFKSCQYALSGYDGFSGHKMLSGHYSLTQLRHHARNYSKKARASSEKKHKDLYSIMGVSPNATQVQIKDSYYRLSMKYHPDRNKGSDDAHQKFTELTEAYSILGQYDLRRKYDKGLLHQYRRQPSHVHTDHSPHHSTAHSRPGTVHGKKSRFDFDEFYRAHYGEALRREQAARKSRAAARERAKLYSISNSWQQVLIIGVTISVLLVGWYGYQWQHQGARTITTRHNQE